MLRVVWALHCSRKRGPLSGAGFLCARDEASFLAICQAAPPLVAATVTTTTTAAPAVCFLPGIQYCFSAFTLFPSSPFLRSFIIFLKISNPLVLAPVLCNRRKFRCSATCVHCLLSEKISREGAYCGVYCAATGLHNTSYTLIYYKWKRYQY